MLYTRLVSVLKAAFRANPTALLNIPCMLCSQNPKICYTLTRVLEFFLLMVSSRLLIFNNIKLEAPII